MNDLNSNGSPPFSPALGLKGVDNSDNDVYQTGMGGEVFDPRLHPPPPGGKATGSSARNCVAPKEYDPWTTRDEAAVAGGVYSEKSSQKRVTILVDEGEYAANTDIASAILADPGNLPRLRGIVSTPPIHPDGSIICRPGYDRTTQTYYVPGEVTVAVKEHPSEADVKTALEALQKPFTGFPFKGEVDWVNYLAFLLTAVMRFFIEGNVPAFVIDAPVQGAGKSKLAFCLDIIATNGRTGPMTVPSHGGDEELRKRLTAVLLGKPLLVILDNVVGRLSSPSLASMLTTGIWNDRRLGVSEILSMPVRMVFVITGVNIEIAEDMSRRCIWVQLDPNIDKPWERSFEFDPENFVREKRGELISALLTLVRNWTNAGQPGWKGDPLGSFERWGEVIGGILQVASIPGFLGNRNAVDNAANQERDALLGFFEGWRTEFADTWKSSTEVLTALRLGDSHRSVLRDSLLEEMLPIIDQHEGRGSQKLTAVLRKYENRVAGNFKLLSRRDTHSKIVMWAITLVEDDPF